MNKKIIFQISIVLILFSKNGYTFDKFIKSHEEFTPYLHNENVIITASPGRSGSTMLDLVIQECASQYTILKTHLLPPSNDYKGKILFIFSNPDLAAESALHLSIKIFDWCTYHFQHLETSDLYWLEKTGNAMKQTEEDNFLSYDALGCAKQLNCWLHTKTKISDEKKGRILAVKYEHLWDKNVIEKIKEFLNLEKLELPEKKLRGYSVDELDHLEILFRNRYNLGTFNKPKYSAYDVSRSLWDNAPPFQYLDLIENP